MMGFTVSVHFFDLSGCEDFKLIREEFYKNSQVCLYIYIYNRLGLPNGI